MGVEANKALVRRFWNEVIVAGDVDALEEIVAPNFVNLDGRGDSLNRLKQAITSRRTAVREHRFDPVEMIGEGDVVFAMVDYTAILLDGTERKERAVLYYKIIDGRIVENMLTAPV